MKTKRVLRKIVSAGFLLALIVIVVMACKKKDDTPIPPGPGPTPPPITTPDVFANRPLQLMTEWEMTNHLPFAGHNFRALGRGMVGEGDDPEIPDPFKKIGKTLWEIYDYKHTEKRFDQIDQGLANISTQLDTLMQMVTDLEGDIEISTADLEGFWITSSIKAQMPYLTSQLDSGGPAEFMYYPSIARQYQASPDSFRAAMEANSKNLPVFSNGILNNTGPGSMTDFITQLNMLLCSTGGSSENALTTYNKTLIMALYPPNGSNVIGGDSAKAFIAYQMLENYFMWIVGAQFQAENILINCANVVDSTNTLLLAETQWKSFRPKITEEITVFLTEVNRFVVYLDDHRTGPRWAIDAQYADAGLAPDNVFINVLARAQFLANSLYDGLGYGYPVMCGSIITPYNYTYDNGTQPLTKLTLNSTKTLTATASKVPSWIPNTNWASANPATCSFDFNWSVFSYGNLGTADPNWPAGSVSISVPFTDANHPWAHSASTVGGNVTVSFYNPMDLNDKSTTYDTVHSMQFGFFSANWKWGYLYLRYDDNYGYTTQNWVPEQIYDYACSDGNQTVLSCAGIKGFSIDQQNHPPFVTGCNTNWWVCSQDSYQNGFNCTIENGSFQMGYDGSAFNYSGGQVDYNSNVDAQVQASSVISGQTAWFAAYGWSYYNTNNSSNQSNLRCKIGNGYKASCKNYTDDGLINNGSVFSYDNSTPNTWKMETGFGGNFSSGVQKYSVGFDFFVNRSNAAEMLNLTFKQGGTVVFGGLGPVPQ